MTDRSRSFLLGFALVGPPLAWTLELVLGYGVSDAACASASSRWGFDERVWQAFVVIGASALAFAGTLAALAVWRVAPRDARGRNEFLAGAAVSASALFLLLAVLTAVGALVLEPCAG